MRKLGAAERRQMCRSPAISGGDGRYFERKESAVCGVWRSRLDGGWGRRGQFFAKRVKSARNLKKWPLKFRLQGPPKPNQQCAPTKFSIVLASLILRETCGTIRCTEQHFYTMMLSHNRFLRLMAMHSILKKDGVHFSVPLVRQVVKMYLKDLYTNF